MHMYSVIRHTFEIVNPEPEEPISLVGHSSKSFGEWKHYTWIFAELDEAMEFAISLLNNPLLRANQHYLDHAIESMRDNRYFQVGRESVAVGVVLDTPKLGGSSEKPIH